MVPGQVSLHYTSNQYKYQQLTLVSDSEPCAISLSTVKDLYEGKLKQGIPHVLTLVHDIAKGQNIYDAAALSENLARETRRKWINPASNTQIRRIDFFAINSLADGYRLLKKIKLNKVGNGQIYEDLWHCSNLALATQDDPYVFHSITALIQHFKQVGDGEQEAKWRYQCFISIAKNYGKGIALILAGGIIKSKVNFLENFLFTSFEYTCFDQLFVGSKLDELVSKWKEDCFERGKASEQYGQFKKCFQEVLKEKSHLPELAFAEFLFKITEDDALNFNDLEKFASDQNLQIAHLAQAALCSFSRANKVEKYIENLTKHHPKWQLGQALMINRGMENLKGEELNKKLDDLISLSQITRDLLVLELVANRFEQFGVRSPIWTSLENICMRILTISRFREEVATQYALALKNDEFENSLFILQNNVKFFETYSSLACLSDLQRELGIKSKKKDLYLEGVSNGLEVFENREKHRRLIFNLGRDLVAEISPFKATVEQEKMGVEILKEEFKRSSPNNNALKMFLAEYLIRKGTETEAREAQKWIEELKKKFSGDLNIHMASIRAHLRFAEKKETLLNIEEMLRECEKLGSSPTLFLLKALWQSHPLRRETQLEWYLSASVNFKKAFENADSRHVQFLLDNLVRYDKLTEEDQVKCRTTILELLGLN